MLIVCSWCKPTKVIGCKVGSADYSCNECGLAQECKVREDWLTFSEVQKSRTTYTGSICNDCFSAQGGVQCAATVVTAKAASSATASDVRIVPERELAVVCENCEKIKRFDEFIPTPKFIKSLIREKRVDVIHVTCPECTPDGRQHDLK